MDKKIRLSDITLENFRNVSHGSITLPSAIKGHEDDADILGIYGQNGSGKTAAIEALGICQRIMAGGDLPGKSHDYINIDSETSLIALTFRVDDSTCRFELVLGGEGDEAVLKEERLYELRPKARKPKLLLEHVRGQRELTPRASYQQVIKGGKDKELDLLVAVRMAEKADVSLFFSEDGGFSLLSEAFPVLSDLRSYATTSFIVLSTNESSLSSTDTLPVTYQTIKDGEVMKGRMVLDLSGPSVIPKQEKILLEELLEEMNVVISTIIPRLRLGLHVNGAELTKEGKEGFSVQLVSYKNGTPIPLRFESEGIIKLISILSVMLSVYNSPSICLVIDEMDASIFEYLLGELVSVLKAGAQGQLIFTSHNLRILEMLDASSIIFSTSNPDNRYIRLSSKDAGGNLRDAYLRTILLGGAGENIYEETDSHEIGKALRKAWRLKSGEGTQ